MMAGYRSSRQAGNCDLHWTRAWGKQMAHPTLHKSQEAFDQKQPCLVCNGDMMPMTGNGGKQMPYFLVESIRSRL